jgi:hypothetical protein
MLYFAYGSNMNTRQMAVRCPGAVPLGPARLPDHILVPRRYADIDPRDGAWTYGVLWEIADAHLDALDRYEGAPSLYERGLATVELLAIDDDGQAGDPVPVPAFVYWMTRRAKRERGGVPFSPDYRASCAQAAREHRLPVNHFEEP